MTSPSPLPAAVRFPWRWIWEAPLLLATCFCVLAAGFTLLELARGLRAANGVHRQVAGAKALLAAEQASFLVALQPERVAPGQVVPVSAGFTCRIASVSAEGEVVLAIAGPRGEAFGFSCEILPGGAPPAFGVPFGLVRLPAGDGPALTSPPLLLSPTDMPALDLPEPLPPPPSGLFERDADIGLLRLSSGTDREDYVFTSDYRDYLEPPVPASGLLVVPGHLWLDRGGRPVHLRLHRNLTIVVRGNLYLGSSLRVSGPGRLVLVAQACSGATFADRDGNGRWSSGDEHLSGDRTALESCIEGTGSVWLGMPGGTDRELTIEAALVAQGEVQLTAPRVEVRGPLLGAAGITAAPERSLTVTGEYLPDIHRERIPGFAVQGPPRPGPLTPVALPPAGARR